MIHFLSKYNNVLQTFSKRLEKTIMPQKAIDHAGRAWIEYDFKT